MLEFIKYSIVDMKINCNRVYLIMVTYTVERSTIAAYCKTMDDDISLRQTLRDNSDIRLS